MVNEQHLPNNCRRKTIRTPIAASLVTGIKNGPLFTSHAKLEFVQRTNEQRTVGFRNGKNWDEKTGANRASAWEQNALENKNITTNWTRQATAISSGAIKNNSNDRTETSKGTRTEEHLEENTKTNSDKNPC